MKKYLLSILIASSIGFSQEVSVFEAGNLDKKNPYGLSSSEKHILKNRQNINSLSSKINELNSNLDSLKSRLEGIESVGEGDSTKLNKAVLKINELAKKVEMSSEIATKNSSETAEIKNVSQQLLSMNEENEKELRKSVGALKKAVSKISNLVNKINSSYISTNEFKSNMKQFVTREEFETFKKSFKISNNKKVEKKTKEVKKPQLVEKKVLSASDKKNLMQKAISEYKRRYFNGAIPKFEKLVGLNYKPAQSNYYLGEMWFVRKSYNKAIRYFKKSAMLNDKASYMPVLLLHTAISFEKTKDKENAKNFYDTLIGLYPNSSEAKTAKKSLDKL